MSNGYNAKHFEDCVFNPFTAGKMLDAYPQISQIIEKDDDKQPHFDMIIRYVCALYDKSSPLIHDEKDLNYRKSVAADVAGFKAKDEIFARQLFESKNDFAVNFTIRFLQRFVKNRVWAMIVSAEFTFWEYTRRLLNPIEGKAEALKEIEIQDATHQRLETYYKDFFGDDEELQQASRYVKMTAESVAKMK